MVSDVRGSRCMYDCIQFLSHRSEIPSLLFVSLYVVDLLLSNYRDLELGCRLEFSFRRHVILLTRYIRTPSSIIVLHSASKPLFESFDNTAVTIFCSPKARSFSRTFDRYLRWRRGWVQRTARKATLWTNPYKSFRDFSKSLGTIFESPGLTRSFTLLTNSTTWLDKSSRAPLFPWTSWDVKDQDISTDYRTLQGIMTARTSMVFNISRPKSAIAFAGLQLDASPAIFRALQAVRATPIHTDVEGVLFPVLGIWASGFVHHDMSDRIAFSGRMHRTYWRGGRSTVIRGLGVWTRRLNKLCALLSG